MHSHNDDYVHYKRQSALVRHQSVLHNDKHDQHHLQLRKLHIRIKYTQRDNMLQ
jgi:hypothetical protein